MKQTNLFSSFLLLISMFFCTINVYAQDKEPYAVLNEDGTVLTFYYDEMKSVRDGMGVGPFSEDVLPDWVYVEKQFSITTVVFDAAFDDCTNLTSTASWFYGCNDLIEIKGLEYLHTDNVTDMSYMFCGCYRLNNIDVSGFKTNKVTNMAGMFADCSNFTLLDVSGFKTDNVISMQSMFRECYNLTVLDVSDFKTNNVTDMFDMFYDCSSLMALDVSGFKTDKVTNMSGMFTRCSGLTTLDVSAFNTEKVESMGGMFYGCSNLTSIDVSDFKTDMVREMGAMFTNCYRLTTLDVSGFNTEKVETMESMFYGCSSLTILDLSNFYTGNVCDMRWMFNECTNLNTIYVGDGWSTVSVITNGLRVLMFVGCNNLVGGAGTIYDPLHTEYDYARIDGGAEAPGYFTYKELTGIQSIKSCNRNPSVVYNLSGIRSSAPQKGINIIGGKKVIVK